ncbi:MAG: acyltransferase [Alphaproteobacteria bacterium]|nr:acyltransferase [Alphaproteobacteria bacterium]
MGPDRHSVREIRALAGARAIPPLLLVLYHYHEAHGYQHLRWFDVIVSKGYLWVEFFFALSGFVLVHAYRSREKFRYLAFLKARLTRLYPLHLFTLLLMVGMILFFRWLAALGNYVSIYDLPAYHPYTSFWSFIANLFLVQAWHLFPRLSWNGVSWFVSVEWFLCLMFPIWLWISRRGVTAGVLAMAFGLLLLRALVSPRIGLDITFDWGVLRGIGDFAVGVGLAMLYGEWRERGERLPIEVVSIIQIAVFALLVYALYATGWAHSLRDYWVLPPMFALIFVLALDRGVLAKVFQSAPLMRLGEWSFAIYMGQTTFLQLLRVAEQRLYPNPPPSWTGAIHILEPISLLILCILWGAVLFYTVERPANAWLRKTWLNANRGTAA